LADKKDDKNAGIDVSELLDLLVKFQNLELHDFQLEAKNLELRVDAGVASFPGLKLPSAVPTKPAALMQQKVKAAPVEEA
jgi:hypothetical protein